MKKSAPLARPYHEFLVPFASRELMNEALEAFYKDVEALREKYRIAEVVLIMSAPAVTTDGIAQFESSNAMGNPNNALSLLASTLGNWRGREYERLSVLRRER